VFILLPVGVDDHTVDRMPVISIGIAVACVLAFLVTWVIPIGSDGEKEAREVMRRWVQQPDLVLPPTFVERFVGPTYEPILRRRAAAAARNPRARPATSEDQARIDELAQRAVAESDASLLRRFSLVPSRGPWQPGWFTSMFLHFGWMHLLGNLLFFYICGPLLEDRWGRLLFLGFYLGCGLLAALAQYAVEPHWHGMVAGASGAIAGCMGAFSFRHARRRVRMGYLLWFIRIFRGTFAISAWLWGIAWFVLQLADYALGGSRGGGVAVGAHLGGFLAGGAFALLLAGSGIEKRFVAPAVDRKVGWSQHPEFFVGIEALARGDPESARRAFQAVLSERPDQLDARVGLARARVELGAPGARADLEGVVARVLAAGPDVLRDTLEQLGPVAEPDRLRPAIAWRVAQALDAAGDMQPARRYYAPARKLEGLVGLKARLRALELDPAPSPEEVNAVRTEAGRIPELAPRAELLLRSVILDDSRAIELPSDEAEMEIERHPSAEPPASAPRPPPRVVPVRIVGREDGRLDIASASGVNPLPLRRVLGIAVGVVRVEDGKDVVLTDLVIGWPNQTRGATVLRATLPDLGLERLYPGFAPRTAYARFLADIEEASRAMRLPAGVDTASFPRYASSEEMTRACHEHGGGG
jgi:membrane associated rhomboid family serine protease